MRTASRCIQYHVLKIKAAPRILVLICLAVLIYFARCRLKTDWIDNYKFLEGLHLQVVQRSVTEPRNCTLYYPDFRGKSWPQHCFQKSDSVAEERPLVAVMVAVTTRNVEFAQIQDLALFKFLLPSLWQTAECGHRYLLVVGYDEGDRVFDNVEVQSLLDGWIKDFRGCTPSEVQLDIAVDFVQVRNDAQKPGPVFIKMAQRAYDQGAEYFYRINDDTELIQPWTTAFIRTLKELGPPYGVVGPVCNQGNTGILTHDFTHRTHMEIFDRKYYPLELTDWWLDDWISQVYGESRTRKIASVEVVHHTYQTRYTVDFAKQGVLESLVGTGRRRIDRWVSTHYMAGDGNKS